MTLGNLDYNKLGPIAVILLGALLLWEGQRVVQIWREYQQSAVQASRQKTKPTHFVNVAKLHLFGLYTPKQLDTKRIPLSDLNFTISGLFLNRPEMDGKALIDVGDGNPAKMFKIGDDLPGGVKLYRILPHAIILERDGRYESLPLDKKPLQFEPPPTALPSSNNG